MKIFNDEVPGNPCSCGRCTVDTDCYECGQLSILNQCVEIGSCDLLDWLKKQHCVYANITDFEFEKAFSQFIQSEIKKQEKE